MADSLIYRLRADSITNNEIDNHLNRYTLNENEIPILLTHYYYSDSKKFNKKCLELLKNPNQQLSAGSLAYILSLISNSTGLHEDISPSIPEMMIQVLNHPNINDLTIETFHSSWRHLSRISTAHQYGDLQKQDFVLYIKNRREQTHDEPYIKHLLKMITQEYCDPTVAIMVSFALTSSDKKENQKTIKSVKRLIKKQLIDTVRYAAYPETVNSLYSMNTAARIRSINSYYNYITQDKGTENQLTNYSQLFHLTIITEEISKALNKYVNSAGEPVQNGLITNNTLNIDMLRSRTIQSLIRQTSQISDNMVKILSPDPELPADYRRKLINLQAEEILEEIIPTIKKTGHTIMTTQQDKQKP